MYKTCSSNSVSSKVSTPKHPSLHKSPIQLCKHTPPDLPSIISTPNSTMAVEINIPVALKPSLRKRFYEALVLWFCLKETFTEGEQTEGTERLSDLEDEGFGSRKQLYFCFVNKLARESPLFPSVCLCAYLTTGPEICAIRKDGHTVTAFGILQPGETRYIFASNNRTENALDDAKEFIEDILTTLGEAEDEVVKDAIGNKKSALFSQMLRKILRFNRPRLEHYLRQMAKEVQVCIESVREGEDGDSARGRVSNCLSSMSARSNNSFSTRGDGQSRKLGTVPPVRRVL